MAAAPTAVDVVSKLTKPWIRPGYTGSWGGSERGGLELADESTATPELVVCPLPALAVGEEATLRLPVRAVPVAPVGSIGGTSLIAPGSPQDVGTDQADNWCLTAVQILNREV